MGRPKKSEILYPPPHPGKRLCLYTNPSDPGLRMWAIGLDPSRLHAKVCERLAWRAEPHPLESMPMGEDADSALDLREYREYIMNEVPSVPPPFRTVGLLPYVISQARTRIGRRKAHGHVSAPPSAPVVPFLERLTIDPPFSTPLTKTKLSVTEESRVVRWVTHFWQRWAKWCYQPDDDRGLELLPEYRATHQVLCQLLEDRASVKHTTLRKVLKRSAPLRRTFRLGACDLPRDWEIRWPSIDSPHEFAAALLAQKYDTHTRDIKEGLARARQEDRILPAWRAYESWLGVQPVALKEIERLLDNVSIRLGTRQ